MKSILSIHKEILRKEYAKSPLGLLEKRLTQIHTLLMMNKHPIPEEIIEQINDIRDENEKQQLEYIERTEKENREAVDSMLQKSMEKEVELLENYIKPLHLEK